MSGDMIILVIGGTLGGLCFAYVLVSVWIEAGK